MLELLRDVNFLAILEARDRELAREVKAGACRVCGGPLNVGNFPRKERGPVEVQGLALAGIRLSFCCGHCRKRHTSPSVRFLGRRIYFEVVFVLACVLPGEVTAPEAAAPPEVATPEVTTPEVASPPAAPTPPPMVASAPATLPGGLLNRYSGTAQERVLRLLNLLLPLSVTGPRPAPSSTIAIVDGVVEDPRAFCPP